jgi:hypothetical protein
MKSFRLAIVIAVAIFCFCRVSAAQNVYGSTTIDIDPDSGIVTATCETDFDGALDGNYQAEVTCTVTDQNGAQVAFGSALDVDGDLGYAQAVVTFSGTPGSTYTATGIHRAFAVLEVQQFLKTVYEDPFNFGNSFESVDGDNYPDYYDWFGPGPEQQTKTNSIRLGRTQDTKTLQTCPTSISINQVWSQPLQNDFPSFTTGVGILTNMIVGPVGTNFNSVILNEIVTPTGNSCPANIKSATDFPTISLGTPFVIGNSAFWEGSSYASVQNAFYDQHINKGTTNLLGLTNVTSCQSTATQVYTCNNNPIGTFTLTNTYTSGFISGQPVTFVSVSKQ